MHEQSRRAVLAALFVNLAIAVFKFIAALFSRSSSMLAESYHSISDTFNQVLLLYGLRQSRKAPDKQHPFGHGKEQFFWSFLVAVILFGVAGTLSIREGYHKFLHPEPISHLGLTYLAIAVSFVFETIAFRIALKKIKDEMRKEQHKNFFETVLRSKDPTTMTVFFEDSLAMVGLLIAAAAITLVHITGALIIDAIASAVIGILLMVFAFFLANETRKLLLGESVTPAKRKRILETVGSFDEVENVISLKTMHIGPDEVLVTLEIDYRDDLFVGELEQLNDRIECEIKKFIPGASVYLEAENNGSKK